MQKVILIVLNIYIFSTAIALGQKLELNIKAEDSLKTALIDSVGYQKNFENFTTLSQELDSLTLLLQKAGFVNTSLDSVQNLNDTLYIAFLNLNKKFDSITINLSSTKFALNQLKRINPNATKARLTIPITNIEATLNYLNRTQVNTGAPFSQLKLINIHASENDRLFADLTSINSQIRRIDDIVIKGYEKFPKSYIRYGARIKKGQIFLKEKLKQRAQSLNNLKFVSAKKDPEVLFTQDSTTIFLYLEKQKANTFDGFLGFTNDSETGDFELNGYLNLQLTNNLNFGESLTLSYKADGGEQLQFKTSIKLPYLFKSPLGLVLDLAIFRRDSTFITVDQSAKINYELTTNSNLYLGYTSSTSNNLQSNMTQVGNVQDFNAQFLSIGGSFVKPSRNPLFNLSYQFIPSVQVGQRSTKNNEDNQIRGTVDAAYLLSLNERNYVFFRDIAGGVISENYLSNELLRFGGALNMRGFEENSIDASIYNVIQSEYRYVLSPTIYAHSVIDFGYYRNEIRSLEEQLLSFGIGLGLSTNSGFLNLIFANGRAGNQNFDFNNTKVHLSLNAQF